MKMRFKMLLLGASLSCALTGHAENDTIADYRALTSDGMPHIQAVIQEAINNHSSGRMDIKKLQKKLRASYLLPVLTARYGSTQDSLSQYGVVNETDSRSYNPVSSGKEYDAATQVAAKTGESTEWMPYWFVNAQWDLSKLVFSREETYSRYVKEQEAYYQQKLVKEVIKIYTELNELLIQRTSQLDVMLELDITVEAAKLDFLTGDYISRMMPTVVTIVEGV